MPLITRLVAGKKNPSRVNLYLDGRFAFALSIDEVVKHGLKKGLVLTADQITSLIETDLNDKAYNKILNFLSYRPRTIKEVRDRLKQYDLTDPKTQDRIIARLKSHGYLNDESFARWFIASRNTHRPRSPRLLIQELRSKGISQETIDAVIAEASPEPVVIRRLLVKKLGSSRPLQPQERQKIYGFLSRQGFSWEVIKEVVKSWESE
jgi:regulatory protein